MYTISCYLCEDLISEIFKRLPPKSLIRFRSLSKSWFSLISYSKFEVAKNTYLYSTKTDSWSEIASPTTTILDVNSVGAVVFNGVLHWLVKYDLSDYIILTFDLSSNVFGSILLPKPSLVTDLLTVYDFLYAISIEDNKTLIWKTRDHKNVATWSLNYTDDDIFESPIAKDCSCYIELKMYVETLELLDRGTACGETFVPLKNNNQKKENSGKKLALVICNHKSDIDGLIGWVLTQRTGCLGSTLALIKKSLKFLPVSSVHCT